MTACDTLERIAKLLPHDERERFFAMIARFRNLPEDDEYLQILEAIGFMTLIWTKVPDQVASILDGANPVQETCQSLAGHVRKAVEDAIPSHDDLRQTAQALHEHELALKQAIGSVQQSRNRSVSILPLIVAFVLGVTISLLLVQWFDSPSPDPSPHPNLDQQVER